MLRVQSGGDNDLVAHVKHDWRSAPLSQADSAMLAYAEKITASPSSMTLDDLNSLRAHFSEEQTLDIVMIASLFNFIDRIADGLGVELDSVLKQMAARSPDGEALTEVAAPMRTRAR